jgi:ABC-2 type transport system ATP-binding protein
MNPVLRIRDLGVGDAARPRLEALDLDLQRGQRLGLLGVNGAGKSTLLLTLAGLVRPRTGRMEIDGESRPERRRRHIGFLPQRVAHYPELTVREHLDWCARLHGLDTAARDRAIAETLERVDLDDMGNRLAGRLSAGQLQRLGLGQALLHGPSLLLLDEPTASLDPVQSARIRALIRDLPDRVSVILATHLFDDIHEACDRVVILADGRKRDELEVQPDTDLMGFFDTPEAASA